MNLQTRVHLEPLTTAHASELFPVLSDPAIYRYIPEALPISVETLAVRCQDWRAAVHPMDPNVGSTG